jgi:hypothetical protein
MHNTTDTIQPGPIDRQQLAAHRYQCRHTFPDGARCGSPALRNETRCYYHHETRKPVTNPGDRNARINTFEFPFPDSRTAVQSALGDLMVRIGSNDIDPRRAGLLLYCLQLAQANLKASELAIAHEAQKHESQKYETQQTTPKISTPTAAPCPRHPDPSSSEHQPALCPGHPNPSAPKMRHPDRSAAEWRDPSISPLAYTDAEGRSQTTSQKVQTDLSCLEDFA